MMQDKPKRKIKPITKSPWRLPAIIAAGIVLMIAGVVIGLFAANRESQVLIEPQIALSVDDACLTPSSFAQTQNQQQSSNYNNNNDIAIVDEPDVIELPGTMTPLPTMVPPVPMPVEEEPAGLRDSGESDSDDAYGTTTESSMPVTSAGGMGGGAEVPVAPPAVLGRSSGDTAIAVPESGLVVATSVASYDVEESYADEDMAGESAELEKSGSDRVGSEYVVEQQQLQPLRAGEIDDNADWDVYQEYRHNYFQQYARTSVHDRDISDRQIIRVVDSNGSPVLGACVQVFHGTVPIIQNHTFATGMTMFFPNLLDATRYIDEFQVMVSKNGISAEATLDRNAIGDTLTITLPLEAEYPPQLDVMFLLDATGSMGDEIQQLQDNILEISSQIDALPGNVDVRYGLVSYRDFGDAYVTRPYPFTDDVSEFQDSLLNVVADGGGDYPEALNQGFYEALNKVQWRDENTVKLVFLVADAPPHVNRTNEPDYSLLMFDALSRGIKVHPIASSGLQPEGEFILRQIAQATMGNFVFLTYDGNNSATPGDDRTDLEVGSPEDEQGIGDYSVNQLDELVLRLITDELAELE